MAGDFIPVKNFSLPKFEKKTEKLRRTPSKKKQLADKPEKIEKKKPKEAIREKDKEPEKVKTEKMLPVRVYFIRMDERTEKIYLAPVRRMVASSKRVEASLKELVKGLSSGEKNRGYLNAVPSSVRVRSVRIEDGIARVDFNATVGQGNGNILVSRLDQIIYTATQFKEVQAVQITINGRRKSTLGSDGLSISGPLHRRR